MNPHRYFFAGLPASGKSTFLTAFWVYANGAPSSALSIESYPDKNQYLTELQEHWFNFTPVPRTPAHSEREVTLRLKRNSDGRRIELSIPDLSGETFEQIWMNRYWPSRFQTLVDGSEGIVFFINPKKIEDGATLEQARQLDFDEDDEAPEEEPLNTIPTEWDSGKSPTEVQIVDCLQLISENTKTHRSRRVAVIISAWDAVRQLDPAAEPEPWLQARLPLLAQFLESNQDSFESAVFGISAQGGDYETEKPALVKKEPHERCIVIGPQVTNETDITAPIQWLSR